MDLIPGRRILCASTRPSTPGCDDDGSARVVDEWLHARNELSIEIFLQDTRLGSAPRHLRLKASPTASSGGIEHPAASGLRGCGKSSVIHPSLWRMCTAARLAS